MEKGNLDDIKEIVKQGYLEKQSRFLKSWRKRWVVLTNKNLYTFKDQKDYKSPTEILPLKTIVSIKSAEQDTNKQNSFKVDVDDRSFYFLASNNNDKEVWIGQIGKAMVKLNVKKEVDYQ